MPQAELPSRIVERASIADLSVSNELAESLALYLETLRRWNRRINLTALALNPVSDAALDRLVVEPLVAARHIRPTDRIALDIGSGGGSPALPIKLAAPWLTIVLVEARARKAAFLREAARALALDGVRVETERFGQSLAFADLCGAVDVVTVRGVRIDADLFRGIREVIHSRGRLFWFGGADLKCAAEPGPVPEWLRLETVSRAPFSFTLFTAATE